MSIRKLVFAVVMSAAVAAPGMAQSQEQPKRRPVPPLPPVAAIPPVKGQLPAEPLPPVGVLAGELKGVLAGEPMGVLTGELSALGVEITPLGLSALDWEWAVGEPPLFTFSGDRLEMPALAELESLYERTLDLDYAWQDRDQEARERAAEAAERERERRERVNEYYYEGYEAIQENRWDRAVQRFDRVIDAKGERADGALYWKAYAQYKQGDSDGALATLARLQKEYAQSRYLKDAKELEASIRQTPVSADNAADEELKEAALRALINVSDEEAIPVLERFLRGNNSPRLKKRALFVMAQKGTPRSREALSKMARGESNPDLQRDAVRYLGIYGGRDARAVLAEIYSSTNDKDVKKQILHAFMTSGEKERLLTAARGENDPELRASAIHWLGTMGAGEELWDIYQKETSVDVKKRILRSMFISGKPERLLEVARNESDIELRKTAIRSLGQMGKKNAGALTGLYASEKDQSVRKEIMRGLFIGGSDTELVSIARQESDPALKKQAVTYLSQMNSKVARDYLLEILNQ